MKTRMFMLFLALGFVLPSSSLALNRGVEESIHMTKKFINAKDSHKEIFVTYEIVIPSLVIFQEQELTSAAGFIRREAKETTDKFISFMEEKDWQVEHLFAHLKNPNKDGKLILGKGYGPRFVTINRGSEEIVGFDPKKEPSPLTEFFERVHRAILDHLYKQKLIPY